MNGHRTLAIVIAVVGLLAAPAFGQDPGVPDTVKIGGGPLYINQSHPLTLNIINDGEIDGATLGFVISSVDGGFARYDSVVFVGRLADPEVWGFRTVNPLGTDGVTPDSILTGGFAMALTRPLPPGNGPIMELYFTGNAPGTMALDSAFIPPAGEFLMVVPDNGGLFTPQYTSEPIEVLDADPLPSLTLSSGSSQSTIGDQIVIDVSGQSPVDPSVNLELVSLNGYDDETELPSNNPVFEGTNPATFRWTPGGDDIGIWQATFQACDSEGACAERTADLQVVENSGYLISFDQHVTAGACYSAGLVHGNFSGGDNPEVVATGTGHGGQSFQLFGYNPGAGLDLVYEMSSMQPRLGPKVGYFDNDEFPDVVLRLLEPGKNLVQIFHGTGADSLWSSDTPTGVPSIRGACLGEFTGDGYLDYATARLNTIPIYDGGTDPKFQLLTTVTVSEEALSLTSADFDDDGRDDLAVGTEAGVHIFLGDGAGGFVPTQFYSQVYGSMDIDVTNEGSDFNDDGYYDLCISTPSIGGEYSEMVVYLGNGDGSFEQNVVRTVKGQILGNCVGDFNGDGELDIGYINGARGYAAILFGDGDGAFTNELRYAISHEYLRNLDCLDIDLDGDIDLAILANLYNNSKMILMTNHLDPQGFEKRSLAISGCNNSDFNLVSSSGLEMNRNRQTMPSGQFFRRSVDQNDVIDQFGTLALVEDGRYTLDVLPKPNLPIGEPFTVEFTVDGEQYRLAKDAPMRPEGYRFSIYPGEASEILPPPGKFISVDPPTFYWPGPGEYDIQVAADIEFSDVLYETVVDGNSYTPPSALSVSGTETVFYWRIKPQGQAEYECLYAVNIVSGSSSSCGDANGDGQLRVDDCVFLLAYMFRGGPAPEPLCSGDANGSGDISVADVIYLINYIFKGGPVPTFDCCP